MGCVHHQREVLRLQQLGEMQYRDASEIIFCLRNRRRRKVIAEVVATTRPCLCVADEPPGLISHEAGRFNWGVHGPLASTVPPCSLGGCHCSPVQGRSARLGLCPLSPCSHHVWFGKGTFVTAV